MKLEDIKSLIEKNYNINVKELWKIKNIFKVEDYDGRYYALKKISYEYRHFNFIINAIMHLQKNGFDGTVDFIKTKSNSNYIQISEKEFGYMNPWIICRESNYDNPIEVENIARFLAKLHLSSRGFIVNEDMKPRIAWLAWHSTFDTRKDEIYDFRRRIRKKKDNASKFDKLYYEYTKRNIELCNDSLKNIVHSNYINRMRDEMVYRGFCHHDTAHHNLLMLRDNSLKIIDFDYCILDTHLHDLASLLIRTLKNGRWSIEKSIDIINAYSEIYPIYYDELPIIAAFIQFPQDFWQIGIQYYWEQKDWGEEFFEKKLCKILDDTEEKNEFAKNLKGVMKEGNFNERIRL